MKKIIILLLFSAISICAYTQRSSECVQCSSPVGIQNGEFASILGKENSAEGLSSIAGGSFCYAKGVYSIALGTTVKSIGNLSISLGSNIDNYSSSGLAFGKFIYNTGYQSATIGMGYGMEYPMVNPVEGAIMIGMYSTAPTLFISKSPSDPWHTGRTGKVGIGNVIDPQAKLHIRADEQEKEADLFIQPFAWDDKFSARIKLGTAEYGMVACYNEGLKILSPKDYFFPIGNVVIGDISEAEAKLHIHARPDEDATLLIEPHTWNEEAKAAILLGNENHGIEAKSEQGLSFHTQTKYMFNDGRVGIGTTDPQSTLDINGTVRVSSLTQYAGDYKLVFANSEGELFTDNISIYDNMGNHQMEQDLFTNNNWIRNNIGGPGGIYLDNNGNVGIGNDQPQNTLSVKSTGTTSIFVQATGNDNSEVWVSNNANAFGVVLDEYGRGNLKMYSQGLNNSLMYFYPTGRIAIGNAVPNYATSHRLFVQGGMTTEEVVINLTDEAGSWPDYVFEEEYKLMPIAELESFIDENDRLPGMPAAGQVNNAGLNVYEMNKILVEKVEELTLYMIQQQKEIETLKSKLNE